MLTIASATVPDGYFGDTQRILVALIDKGIGRPMRMVCVTQTGAYYPAPVTEVADRAEAE